METSHVTKASAHFPINFPPRMLVKVCEFLDAKTLFNATVVNKSWRFASNREHLFKELSVRQLGSSLAQIFVNGRQDSENPWKRVVKDVHSPFKIISQVLGTVVAAKKLDTLQNQQFQAIRIAVIDKNIKVLRELLMRFEQNKLTYLLNVSFKRSSSENRASILTHAVRGKDVNVAKLLIEYGAKDFVEDIFVKKSSLCIAAAAGNLPMVQLLLEHGAGVDLDVDYRPREDEDFEDLGVTPIFLLTQPAINETKVIECILLMMKAWIATDGAENVAASLDAKKAFREAIKNGKFLIAKIFIAFGVKLEINKGFKNFIKKLIENDQLDALKFIHENQLCDLEHLRQEDGSSLLSLNSETNSSSIEFLASIGR